MDAYGSNVKTKLNKNITARVMSSKCLRDTTVQFAMPTLFTQNINCSLRARVSIVRVHNTGENVTQQALLLYVELTFSYFSVSLSEVAYTKKLLRARKQHTIS